MEEQSFKDFMARLSKVMGELGINISTQLELAGILGIQQSSVSDAKRRNSIPSDWLLTLLLKYGIHPRRLVGDLTEEDAFKNILKECTTDVLAEELLARQDADMVIGRRTQPRTVAYLSPVRARESMAIWGARELLALSRQLEGKMGIAALSYMESVGLRILQDFGHELPERNHPARLTASMELALEAATKFVLRYCCPDCQDYDRDFDDLVKALAQADKLVLEDGPKAEERMADCGTCHWEPRYTLCNDGTLATGWCRYGGVLPVGSRVPLIQKRNDGFYIEGQRIDHCPAHMARFSSMIL